MAIPLYLAVTAAETAANPFPEYAAYMACHFASYGSGLSNLPVQLPEGAMLILNDRIPVWEHDPAVVAQQLTETVVDLKCCSVLLDFQRSGDSRTAAIAKAIVDALPCPVGISEHYAANLSCPVFLSAPPPDMPLERHTAPWEGRAIWLEAALETIQITVTQESSTVTNIPIEEPTQPCHKDERLCCCYHIELMDDRAVFTISRTQVELEMLLHQAEELGIQKAVGLFQQLGNRNKNPAD